MYSGATVALAAEKAGVDTYSIIRYPDETGFFSSLMNEGKDQYIHGKLEEAWGEPYHYLQFMKNLKDMDRIQARLPFDLRIQ